VVTGCKTEEHIFWDCKLYKEQRATMMDILKKGKKGIPKVSYRALNTTGKKDLCKAPVTS
jgi:hypothetical protein